MSDATPPGAPVTYQPEPFDPADPMTAQRWSTNPIHELALVLPRRPKPRWVWPVTIAAVAGVGVAAWVLFGGGPARGPSATSTPTIVAPAVEQPAPAPPARAETPRELAVTLEQIALQTSDVNAPFEVQLMRGGDLVRGEVTLDNCGVRFATEAHRVVRRQYVVVDPQGNGTGVSNEVVAYDTAAHAAAALDEWKRAAQHCPSGLRHLPAAGTPGFYEKILHEDDDATTLPNPSNAVTLAKITVPGKHVVYALAAIQIRGRILDAIWVNQNQFPTGSDIRATLAMAGITGGRLAELP